MPTTGSVQNPRVWATGSIASGAALSNEIDLMGYRPIAFDLSSGFEGANAIAIEGSENATTWYPLFTSTGGTITFTSGIGSATGRCVVPVAEIQDALAAHRYLRLRSAGNQSTGVTFSVRLMPL